MRELVWSRTVPLDCCVPGDPAQATGADLVCRDDRSHPRVRTLPAWGAG